MNHQGLGVPYVGQVGENVQVVDEVSGCLEAVLQFDGEDGACALGQVFLLELMVRRGFEARIVDFSHLRMFFKEFSQLLGVGYVTFYAERQGFQALDEEPGGNGEMAAPVSRRTLARMRVTKPAPGTSVAKLMPW